MAKSRRPATKSAPASTPVKAAPVGDPQAGASPALRVRSAARGRFRVAFIGAGGIAGTQLQYLTKMPDVEIVGLQDVVRGNAERHADAFKLPRAVVFDDAEEMLRRVKPDGVSVCSPNAAHAAGTILALRHGAHVIVEKPMAANAAEAQRMLDAAKAARRKLVIGFQHRFHPRTQYLKEAADAGQFGKILFGRVQALRRRGIPNWGVFGQKKLQGGGPLIDIGVHVLEMAHYTMGSPKPVSAIGNTYTYLGNKRSDRVKTQWSNWDYKTYTVEDLAVGQIRFDSGAILAIEASYAAHIEKDAWTFQLMGEKGGCSWDPPMIFRDEAGHMINSAPAWLAKHDFGDAFAVKMRAWVEHCLYHQPTIAPGEAGLVVQKMIDGIYASAARGGREVAIT